MLQKHSSVGSQHQRSWIIGPEAIGTLEILTKSFRHSALSQVILRLPDAPKDYLPWMDSFVDHQSPALLRPHRVKNHLLIDEGILREIESTFERDENPLGLLLPEEKSFRVRFDIENRPEEVNRYQEGLRCFDLTGHYWQKLFVTLCNFVVPIYSTRESIRLGGVGFSSLRSRGAIFLSVPKEVRYSHIEIAINLAHELGHQAVMIYQGADRILEGDLNRPIYSVVRKTMRPAIRSFHALVAVTFMLNFVCDLLRNDLDEDERAFLQSRLTELATSLREGIKIFNTIAFTEVGQKLFLECKALDLKQFTQVEDHRETA